MVLLTVFYAWAEAEDSVAAIAQTLMLHDANHLRV